MAKKKTTNQLQSPIEENPRLKSTAVTHQPISMEEPKEKLRNLKSLNAMLIKETIEKREQIKSLMQAKEALEIELSRFGKERCELDTELTRESEKKVSLEVQNGVFCFFMDALLSEIDGLVREKEGEIVLLKSEVSEIMGKFESEKDRLSKVCGEKDFLRSDLDGWIEEANRLKERVIEMEKKEEINEEKLGKLRVQYASVIKQKDERKREIEELKVLRDSAERNLVEQVKKIEDLNGEIEGIVREKNGIETERNRQKFIIRELEQEVSRLNGIVSGLKANEGVLRGKVLELEASCGEAMEKEKAMGVEIDALMEEKREKEKIIESLIEEKNSSEKIIETVNSEVKVKDELVEKLLREKKEIVEVEVCKESEIAELRKEVGKLRDNVFAMQESINNQENENKKLELEVSNCRDAFEQVKLERDNARKGLEEEGKNSMNLRSKALEMEMKIEETAKEFVNMKIERDNLIREKKEMECQLGLLKEDKDTLQNNLFVAQRELDDLRDKMESAAINSEKALTMLKNTAALVCQSINGKEPLVLGEMKLDNEIEPFATELEMIKNAFRNKETVVEEMKQQVELLQNTVATESKKKSFWTLITSATTVFAAVSLAYVSRLH